MKQIEKALLGLLINYQKKYITSHELASELSLSDRTIRKYMVDVKEKIEKNGAKIIAKQGQGYQLAILKPLPTSPKRIHEIGKSSEYNSGWACSFKANT